MSSTLGQRIRAARKSAGLNQEELATAISLTRSSVANIEADRQIVPADRLMKIAAWTHSTAAGLLGESDGARDEEMRAEGRAQAARRLGITEASPIWALMVKPRSPLDPRPAGGDEHA